MIQMIIYILMLAFVLPALSAPTWCYVLAWIGVVLLVLNAIVSAIIKALKDL